jgi:hypothetical protein
VGENCISQRCTLESSQHRHLHEEYYPPPKKLVWTNMFSRAGIVELHATTHERLDLLLRHLAKVPEELLHRPSSVNE